MARIDSLETVTQMLRGTLLKKSNSYKDLKLKLKSGSSKAERYI